MKLFFRRLWCAFRDHPYPHVHDPDEYQDWVLGNVPYLPLECSHCGRQL